MKRNCMAGLDLQSFLADLQQGGELCRIRAAVDPCLEIAAVTDRVCKEPGGGKALLFEQVIGSGFPVATNLFGSFQRLNSAFGIKDRRELESRMTALFQGVAGNGLAERAAAASRSNSYLFAAPLLVNNGCCQEVVEDNPDLNRLPLLKNWPMDGFPNGPGRTLGLPLVFTSDTLGKRINCGIYRVELLTGRTAALHWRKESGGGTHYEEWRRVGRRMPIAIALGGDPLLTLAASFSLPEPLEELHLAGYLRGAPMETVRCRESDLLVPAWAELVVEGYLEPGEMVTGGRFGNHTGYYREPGLVPLMHVTAITHRTTPVLPATVIGPPPMEDCYLAKAAERLLLPCLRQELPEVVEINLPMEGIFHGCALIAINKDGDDHPEELMQRIWQKNLLGEGRLLVLLDADTDLNDTNGVAWRVINRADWKRDLISPAGGRGEGIRRLGIDATRKMGRGGAGSDRPMELRMTEDILALVAKRWREYGLAG